VQLRGRAATILAVQLRGRAATILAVQLRGRAATILAVQLRGRAATILAVQLRGRAATILAVQLRGRATAWPLLPGGRVEPSRGGRVPRWPSCSCRWLHYGILRCRGPLPSRRSLVPGISDPLTIPPFMVAKPPVPENARDRAVREALSLVR